jgi:hypothetical protein
MVMRFMKKCRTPGLITDGPVSLNGDYKTNLEAKREIEELQAGLDRIETDKLDKIIAMLQEIRTDRGYSTE